MAYLPAVHMEADGLSHVGLKARSPEGHAARAMHIKGDEYVWVEIQQKTFTNWVNEQLRQVGLSLHDLQTDFCDGLKLIALVEVLQKRKLKKIRKPINQHQCLENVQIALNAMAADNIKLVNIGNTDIVEGNLKLILGLIWSLILRYQIGRTNFPPKKLMLAWLQAVLPELRVSNFTGDWNSGIALSALLDYCKPGLYPHWKSLNPKDGVNNCHVAMNIAKDEFNIPMILTPEDLASHNMDELSGMTYLSYFMKEDSPGYNATLSWVQKQLPHLKIRNFTSDWNDGLALCSLVHSLGAHVPGFPNIQTDPSHWEQNLQKGINAGKYLGVEPVLRAKEMADPEVQHLGVMAYIARFQFVEPRKRSGNQISITGTDLNKVHVNKTAHFKINILDNNVEIDQIRAEIKNATKTVSCHLNINKNGGTGSFIPTDTGLHELIVYCEGEVVTGCPLKIHVHPDISRILFSGIDPCALGSIVEVLINSNGAGGGNVQVEAVAPSGKTKLCPVIENHGVYTATFTPDEIGEWMIGVTYSGEHINGSPFTCYVYDPAKVKVQSIRQAYVGQEFTFTCDASEAGWGEVKVDVQHNGHSVPLQVDERGNGLYRISFTPLVVGKYKAFVSFNGIDLKQSPFSIKAIQHSEESHDVPDGQMYNSNHVSTHFLQKNNMVNSSSVQHQHASTLLNASSEISLSHSSLKVAKETQQPVFSHQSNSKLEHVIGSPALKKIESSLLANNSKHDADPSSGHAVNQNSLKRMLNKETIVKNPKAAPPLPPEKPGKIDVKTRSWVSRNDQHEMISSQNHTETNEVQFQITGSRPEGKTTATFQSVAHQGQNTRLAALHSDHHRTLLSAGSDTAGISSSSEMTASSSSKLHVLQEERLMQSKHLHQLHTQVPEKFILSGSLGRKTKGSADITSVTATGEGLNFVPVKRPVTFSISAKGFEADDINVTVTAPSGREIPIRLDTLRVGHYEVEYITPEVGEHVIEVMVAGKSLKGSPFHCFAYDASKIKVGKIPDGLIGQAVEFEIDGAEAGSGNLEILVNGGHVTSQVKNLGNHRFLASFIPHNATVHTIEMKFNGETVPGSPWRCEVMDAVKKVSAKGSGLKCFSVGHTSFNITAPGVQKDEIQLRITGPGKGEVQPCVIDLHNGNFRVEYSAFDVGNYTVEVQISGKRIPGSPFTAKAYDAKRIIVTDIPKSSTVGQTCQFQVDASQAGEGQLEISVNDGEVPNQVQVLGNGHCLVIFKPEAAISHTIDIKFNGENVPGCPFVVDVANSMQFALDLANLELVPVGRTAHFQISVAGGCESDLHVTMLSPSGSKVPVKLSQISSHVFSGEFTPKEIGPHSVTVEYAGTPVSGSPFTVKVYNAQKVLVSGVSHGIVGKTIQFTVDASHAGEGNLEITVSARGRNIPTQVHPMGSARFGVSFIPAEAVEHVISIGFNKEPVSGSPFKVKITDASKVSVRSSSLVATSVHKTASFVIQNVSSSEKDISVKVEAPNGSIIPARVLDSGGNSVKVDYTPVKTGEYRIHVQYMGSPVLGSPFISKVFDARQIIVKDIPLGIVGHPVVFMVETSQAGPGNLEVTVNNGQVPTTSETQSPNLYAISFVPQDARLHMIDLKFNGEPVPGSPFECNVFDPSKIKASGDGLERVAVHRTSSFFIDTHSMNVGDCQVTIIGPLQKPIDAFITGNQSTGYKVEYTPTDIGDHSVDVRVLGTPISGSPFLVKAYDATKVKVSDIGSGIVGKPVYFSIDASQAGAGNLEIIVSVNGRNVPNYVQSEGNAKFRVNFKPSEPHTHTISVKFNSEPVPGSPFYVKILDSNHSIVTGTSLRMAAISKGAHFTIDTRGIENADCNVAVTAPSGKKLPVNINKASNSTFTVEFSPTEVGPHQVIVTLDGSPVPGSPFTCNVYDVNKINVTGLNPGLVGKPLTFQVDASQAGEGTLELVVTTRKSSVRAEVSMRSRGLYDVTFVPQEKTSHYVNITFNEDDVPNSPFKIEVRESQGEAKITESSRSGSSSVSLTGESSKQGLVGSVNVFEVDASALDNDVEIKVTGPQDVPVQTTVVRTEKGRYRAEYLAREVGTYKVEVLHQGTPICNKPFLLEVCDPSRVKVMDVEDGVIGRSQTFRVDTSRAGRGTLTINITSGGREVRHTVKEIGGGMHQVTYIPRNDFPHKIEVLYNGHQAPGCPQIVEMRDPSQSIIVHGAGLKCTSLDKNATFMIETGGFGEAKDFDIIVTGPNGSPLPVKCYQQKDGSLLVEWTPQETGSHKVDVLYLGKAIGGSPYTCHIFDASKISIQKIKTTTFTVNERISFALNRRDAGYAELDVTVTSPLGRHLPIEVKGTVDGEGETIEFTPTVPGKYKIAITYGGIEVPGSPITFIAQEGGTPKIEGNGLNVAQFGKPAVFTIDGRGLWGKPEVRIEGPDTEAESTIEEEQEGLFVVTYIPQEIGVFDICVLWNNRDVPGSPFHPRVVNTENVRIIGGWKSIMDDQGRISLSVGEEKRIPFDITDAGPGKLKAEVRGPNGMIDVHVEQMSNHRYRVCFTPQDEGEYYLYLYYADLPLPQSPFLAYAEEISPALDHTRVVLRGHGLAGARVGQETEFVVDGSEAGPGLPEISLSGVKADIPVKLTPLGNNIYKAVYTPTIPGAYLLNVMWSDRQVKGCPLKVTVIPSCDASKVVCSGDGLRGGTVGKEIKAFIDTRRAGPGELTAHCTGPHKVAYCELYDHRDGTFTLYLKPQEGGRHVLTIKYGGEHVIGSPFTLRIAGAPDASKVRVYGPGIEPGVLATYQSRFICDTRGAGAGQLTVRIRGPKGAFRVEMQRESQKDRTILCKYDPTEPGDYRLEVKWSGEHVPGSPFVVMIFDTQQELNRYLQGQSGSTSGPSNLLPADYFGGSMTYSTGFGQMSWRGSTAEL